MTYLTIFRFAADISSGVDSLPNSGKADAPNQYLPTILQILFGVLGSVALLVIVISGMRYVVASGDPAAVAKARSTIVYAIVGLAVAMAGFSIVTFVVKGIG